MDNAYLRTISLSLFFTPEQGAYAATPCAWRPVQDFVCLGGQSKSSAGHRARQWQHRRKMVIYHAYFSRNCRNLPPLHHCQWQAYLCLAEGAEGLPH